MQTRTRHRKRVVICFAAFSIVFVGLMGRLAYLMIAKSEEYSSKAQEIHERERKIKALRGRIFDRNGELLAANKTVCTISVIHNQITDPERVIQILVKELGLSEEYVRKRVEKYSSIEKIKTNVDKEVGDIIRGYDLDGVKVDEDYKRYYVYDSLASKVIGFTGSDNQGIVGLEVAYDQYLQGTNGLILTVTDAKGIEIEGTRENRLEPVAGNDLVTSLDLNIQMYAEQLARRTLEAKEAKSVSIIVMNPQNGEILAMASVPEYNLNDPFTLNYDLEEGYSDKEYQDALNKMWRNGCINDTYEPGSTFKMITATAALETGVVSLDTSYTCPGFKIVEDRRIRCHKTTGHGTQSFTQTVMNSCNPAFIEWGLRVGVDSFYDYMTRLGLMEKTGIDLPGEASTIIHKKENVGQVELATMSFGQSFQITPMQLLRAASAIINGGTLVTPHFGLSTIDADGVENKLLYKTKENAIEPETSEIMKEILHKVVSEGGGRNAKIEGYAIGGKTATSQKLPRSEHKYIGSFIGFVPVEDPQIIAMCIIDEPTGVYYGGTIAAPVIRELFENILPYLGIEKETVVDGGNNEQN
ncbi:MAG: peptidoglycan D,D-transpeptidase FtsI family protein [Lachnospiraceae bacterium]